jgi:hypothetical protein
MKQEDERGFLSGKFENWSGEPIPNGWNSIESKLYAQKRRNNLILACIPLLIMLSYFAAGPDLFFEKSGRQEAAFSKKENMGSNSVRGSRTIQVPVPAMQSSAGNAALSPEVSHTQTIREKQKIQPLPVERQYDGENLTEGKSQYASNFLATGSPDEGLLVSVDNTAGLKESAASGFLSSRSPEFVFNPPGAEPVKPVLIADKQNSTSSGGWFNRFLTFQAAWAVSEIEINHAQSEKWKYSAGGSGFSKAGSLSLGFRLEKPLKRTTSLLYGVDAGVFVRRTETQSLCKIPLSYQMISQGNSRYQVLPEHQSENEIRDCMLAFARAELGIRQAITRNSGIIVSASLWTRLASASRSSLKHAAEFRNTASPVAPGGRIGYWLQTAPFTRLEFSFATMPENLSPQTQSLVFRTNTLGFTLAQGF